MTELMTDVSKLPPQLGVQHYYREYSGKDYLSGNFKSDLAHTPEQLPPRATTSDVIYQKMRESEAMTARLPWGRERSYAGIMDVNLPADKRPKCEPPEKQEKGHRHYGSGAGPFPRGEPIEQDYELTDQKRSNVRSNDQLVPRPEHFDASEHQIKLPFPAQHQFASHTPRVATIPNFDNPQDPQRGTVQMNVAQTHLPSAPHPYQIVKKTFGHGMRWERVKEQNPSQRHVQTWSHKDTNFSHEPKPADDSKQIYPTPSKSLEPNLHERAVELAVSPRTANALRNCERNLHRTTYNDHFTGYGNQNSLKLDNWEDFKAIYERNKHAMSAPLAARSQPTFIPPRPLEGRVAKLLWQRGTLNQPELRHYFEDKDNVTANKELVDDFKEYKSLPEGYQEQLDILNKEAQMHAEYAVHRLAEEKISDEQQQKLVEKRTREQVREANQQFMRDLGTRHQLQLRQLDAFNRWKRMQLMEPRDQMIQYRNQMNYVIPIERPNSFYDHHYKVFTARAPFIFEGENPYIESPTKPFVISAAPDEVKSAEEKSQEKKEVTESPESVKNTTHPKAQVDQEEFKVIRNVFPEYLRAKTAPDIRIPNEMLGGALTRTMGRPYSYQQLLNIRGRLEPNEMKPEVRVTTKESVVVEQPEQPSETKSVFFPHPDEKLVNHEDKLEPHHIHKFGQDLVNQEQADLDMSRQQKIANKTVSFLDERRAAEKENPHENGVWYRDYGPKCAQAHFDPMSTKNEEFHFGVETRPNYGLYASIPKYNTRLLQLKNDFNKTAVRKEFLESFPESAPDLRTHRSEGRRHNFYGYNAYYFH